MVKSWGVGGGGWWVAHEILLSALGLGVVSILYSLFYSQVLGPRSQVPGPRSQVPCPSRLTTEKAGLNKVFNLRPSELSLRLRLMKSYPDSARDAPQFQIFS